MFMDNEPGCNTILVVEDNPQALKLLSLYLAQAGYRVLIASTGRQALLLAVQHRPLAITLDLLLPDMDGWQVLTELKAMPCTRNIPVLIVSVLDRQELGFRLGALDYLVKPVERAQLLHALRRCIPHQGEAYRKVMVVHSDLEELNLLSGILAQENYQVIQALGTEEAVNLAKCARPDLVVTYLMAGDGEFLCLLEKLKAAAETARIPVLALMASAINPVAQACEEGTIEFVLLQENELLEDRLLTAITLLFSRTPLSSANRRHG
jgi:DNA-binding response OmpR family regulator